MSPSHPPKRKLTDEEKLVIFMRSFHVMSQKEYWPALRDQSRVNVAGKVEVRVNPETGQVAMQRSPLDPMPTDLAGAYMRKLITGTDLVTFGSLINAARRKFGQNDHLDEAKSIWSQTEERTFDFLADGDKITTIKMEIPEGLRRTVRKDTGAREEVSLSIRDFTQVYFYDGFLHDQDDDKDSTLRRRIRSMAPVYQERMSHLAIAAGLYVALIAHAVIRTHRPDLCPTPCAEGRILDAIADGNSRTDDSASDGESSRGQATDLVG